MNAAKATSLVPLYGGVALLVLAATGAALSLADSEGRAKGAADTRVVAPTSKPVSPRVGATRKPPKAVEYQEPVRANIRISHLRESL